MTGNTPGGAILDALPFTAGKYCSTSPAFWTGEHLTAAFVFAAAGEVVSAPTGASGAAELPPPPRPGTVTIEEGKAFLHEEVESANFMAKLGYKDVQLRAPVGTRAGGETSDLLVNGELWDVYSPLTKSPDRIVGGTAAKGSQVHGGGVIVNLRNTSVSAEELLNIEARVAGSGGRVTRVIVHNG